MKLIVALDKSLRDYQWYIDNNPHAYDAVMDRIRLVQYFIEKIPFIASVELVNDVLHIDIDYDEERYKFTARHSFEGIKYDIETKYHLKPECKEVYDRMIEALEKEV